jgi:hypothetical protein
MRRTSRWTKECVAIVDDVRNGERGNLTRRPHRSGAIAHTGAIWRGPTKGHHIHADGIAVAQLSETANADINGF